ncbi:hypothetical protein GCM10025760_20270 [Microbacterium yannicii]|uniref:HTH tetR-type domain-containing protein n=1 Tax=Microbacterium yannicii TaxID=671622 RepID=A0ABP9MAR5_9MICO|nr:TetR family transcriptional regulator [Microbacterium yannicii]MCO5952419.1 TetR/AcrR family transcriptional regulator [Microbacterium yannicii]
MTLLRDRATASNQTQRRVALLERLVDVILREGFADASVEDLARELQCSKTTLYGIAPSKEAIVVAGVRHFFRRAADRVEIRLLRTIDDPLEQIRSYLVAISEQLAPASATFFADLDAWPATREIYQTNTRAAAEKVQSLVREAASGDQNAAFVGAVAAQVMEAIHRGEIETTAGLDDSAAYRALAELIVRSLHPSDEAGEA